MKIVTMTVITKPISGKKPDKLEVPLVENEQVEHLVSAAGIKSERLVHGNTRLCGDFAMDEVATSVFGFFHKNVDPWTKGRNILCHNLK